MSKNSEKLTLPSPSASTCAMSARTSLSSRRSPSASKKSPTSRASRKPSPSSSKAAKASRTSSSLNSRGVSNGWLASAVGARRRFGRLPAGFDICRRSKPRFSAPPASSCRSRALSSSLRAVSSPAVLPSSLPSSSLTKRSLSPSVLLSV